MNFGTQEQIHRTQITNECIFKTNSYFLTAMMKCHDHGDSHKEGFVWVYSSRRIKAHHHQGREAWCQAVMTANRPHKQEKRSLAFKVRS